MVKVMQTLRACWQVALVAAVTLLPFTHAHSKERNPITYITRIDNATIQSPAQRVNALSTFEVYFHLHNGDQAVRLTLAPNHDVIAPGAQVQYLAADGSIHSSQPLNRLDYRVFKGSAWIKHTPADEWANVGWARIMVQQDGEWPLFEGAFQIDGDHHHIQTRSNYMQTKHLLDPAVKETGREYMVVWRDSDITANLGVDSDGHLHADLKRSYGTDLSCSADSLAFNSRDPLEYGRLDRQSLNIWEWGSISTRRMLGRDIDGQTTGNSAGVNLRTTIGNSAGCPTTKKIALVGIATDCTYTRTFNSSDTAKANIIRVLNSASTQFENSFNITLGLQNLLISNETCPGSAQASVPWNVDCAGSPSIQDRLNLFSGWRGQQNDNNTYWTLLSNCPDNTAVGLAWLGQACVVQSQVTETSSGNETVSGANVVVKTGTEWQVLAHETGHTFGAVHDCDSSACSQASILDSQQCCPFSTTSCDAGSRFLMNPNTLPNIQNFSPCSVGNVCSAIGRNSVNTKCLVSNKDVKLLEGSQCGNGIVEEGEDCDCGGTAGCGNNSCCNPTTCRFTEGSQCDPSSEACCNGQCKFASNGTVCRPSTGVCDPQETCDGNAAACPEDVTAPDGQSCGNSSASLQCSSGQCTSRDMQCKTIMGSLTQKNDTYACSHSGCQISCASPEFGSNVCFSMQQFFLDGTSCQGGGKCRNGACKGSSVGKEIKNWIDDNRTLVIALASVLGSLLVLIVLSCVYSCWRRGRNRKRLAATAPIAHGWPAPGGAFTSRALNWGSSPPQNHSTPYTDHTPNMSQWSPPQQSARYA